MTKTPQYTAVIAGIGNLLMGDDGVGIHAVRELQKDPSPGIEVVDVGTAIVRSLSAFEHARRVLVIDAVRAGGRPGSIYILDGHAVDRRKHPTSLHLIGLPEAMGLLGGGVTPEVTILGVEPAWVDYGTELSPAVQAVLPEVVETARRIVFEWCTGTPRNNPAEKVA
jgi:hydrogenase maturation protease